MQIIQPRFTPPCAGVQYCKIWYWSAIKQIQGQYHRHQYWIYLNLWKQLMYFHVGEVWQSKAGEVDELRDQCKKGMDLPIFWWNRGKVPTTEHQRGIKNYSIDPWTLVSIQYQYQCWHWHYWHVDQSAHLYLPCLYPLSVYSRLLSAMCSKLAVCPDRPPSSSSSSPPVWCWNSSFDRSPELEGFSSFWMSLLGSTSTQTQKKQQSRENQNVQILVFRFLRKDLVPPHLQWIVSIFDLG